MVSLLVSPTYKLSDPKSNTSQENNDDSATSNTEVNEVTIDLSTLSPDQIALLKQLQAPRSQTDAQRKSTCTKKARTILDYWSECLWRKFNLRAEI